jgi:hypothetical protein
LGAEVFLVGRVGNDFLGERLLACLKENGVRTEFVRCDPTMKTAAPIAPAPTPLSIVPETNMAYGKTDVDTEARGLTWPAPAFVWSVWLVTLLATLGFVAKFGSNVPFVDDWVVVPVLTGHEPDILNWLWSQHNEHRLPVPKLVLLALYRLTGCDFRAGMYFNVVALAAVAGAMIQAAQRLRGWTSYADAFYPLGLLHWGQWLNFLWSWQVDYILSTTLASGVLLVIAGTRIRLTVRSAVLAGICLILLPLCGATGLGLVPALALWLAYCGVVAGHPGAPLAKVQSVSFVTLAVLPLLVVASCFVGYERPTLWYTPVSTGLKDYLRTAFQLLTLILGRWPAMRFWPFSWMLVIGASLGTAGVLVAAWYRQPQVRFRAMGFLLFMAAMLLLALGLGWGRAGMGYPAGFEDRYVTLPLPLLCCIYLVWADRRTRVGSVVQLGLLALMAVVFAINLPEGLRQAAYRRERADAFQRDLRAGVPIYILLGRYTRFFHISQRDLADGLHMLQQAGFGPYRELQADPAFVEIPVPLTPTSVNQVTWEGDTGQATDADPYLVFALPQPRFVAGIKVRFCHANREGTGPVFRMSWKKSDGDDFTERRRWTERLPPSGPEVCLTIWVVDTVGQFRLHPDDKPCDFQISKICLLVPKSP